MVEHLFVFEGNGKIKDFPGNYSDYRRKQIQIEKARKASEKKIEKKEENIQIKNDYSQRLSFNEKHEFEELEKELETLNNQKELLEKEMNDGNINHEILLEKSQKYEQIKNKLDEKEMRWLELSERA
jgi:ATP-binding cassette subfamily F protein uup